MGIEKTPIGAVVGSGFLVILVISILTGIDATGSGPLMFFLFGTLGLGVYGLIAAIGRFGGAATSGPSSLQKRLEELDQLKEDDVLTVAEHRRKRKQLVDAWGLPDDPADV